MARLSLSLFGGFRARTGSTAVPLSAKKARALMAYLAVHPARPVPRDAAAALLWGDTGDEQARQSLRQTLVALRKALPRARPPILLTAGDTLALNAAAIDVDVVQFEDLVERGTVPALTRATALYQGEFLAGFRTREAPFEEWLRAERLRLRQRAADAFGRLLAHELESDRPDAALVTAAHLLTLDPAQESVHRALMRLHAGRGSWTLALKQYQACVAALQRDLGVGPDAETRALHREIVERRARASAPAPAAAAAPVSTHAAPRAERGPRAPRSRVGASARGRVDLAEPGAVELVGRDAERAELRRMLREAAIGRGQAAAILGEAGIGKSRLAAELAADAARQGARVLIGRCHESEQILPFAPWVEAMRASHALGDADVLASLGPARGAELGRLFPELSASGILPTADAADARLLFDAMAALLARVAADTPLVVIVEDIHWADEMTARLFAFAGRRLRSSSALLVATARDEELAVTSPTRRALDELEREGALRRFALSPLSEAATLALVDVLVRAGGSEDRARPRGRDVWTLSEGHPLMVVETVRALQEGRTDVASERLPLPQRMRTLIADGLQRLGSRARHVADVAAVIARSFEVRLVQAAVGLNEIEMTEALDELMRRRLLHSVDTQLDFTHDRIREVAYASMVPARRTALHALIVDTMERVYAADLAPHFSALTRHAVLGELPAKAADYLREAGAQAVARGALAESAQRYEEALRIVTQLPPSAENTRRAIDVRLDLHLPLFALGQLTRLIDLHREAARMAEELGDERRQGRIAYRMGSYAWMRGHYTDGLAYARQALEIATAVGDRELRVAAAHIIGVNHEARGEYAAAIRDLVSIVESADSGVARSRRGVGIPTYVAGCAWLAVCCGDLGEFARAVTYGDEGVREAEHLSHALARGLAYAFRALPALTRGDFDEAVRWAERSVRLSDDKDLTAMLPVAYSVWGAALAWSGRAEEALPHLERSVVLQNRSAVHGFSVHLSQLYLRWAEALRLVGRLEEALERARRARDLAADAGERANEARALHLLAALESDAEPSSFATAAARYERPLALATALGMRPLLARCHLDVGTLPHSPKDEPEVRSHLLAAVALFQEIDAPYWLDKAETALAKRD
jgi:DNA-binding SARP family transcriptional activator/tetratricopeptide (TPR) repeat protein